MHQQQYVSRQLTKRSNSSSPEREEETIPGFPTDHYYLKNRIQNTPQKDQPSFELCAQEIESPYNRLHDALMLSDDEEDMPLKAHTLPVRHLSVTIGYQTSPERPIINLLPLTQNAIGNISSIKASFQHNFLRGDSPDPNLADNNAFYQYSYQQPRHYSDNTFTTKYTMNDSEPVAQKLQEIGLIRNDEDSPQQIQKQAPTDDHQIEEEKSKKDSSSTLRNLNDQDEMSCQNDGDYNQGKWIDEEHQKFLEGLVKFGKNWNSIQKFIGTRSCPQTRSHAQKFFRKMQKQGFLVPQGSAGENELGFQHTDSSDEDKKKSNKRRQKITNSKSNLIKEKLMKSTSKIHQLELQVIDYLNNNCSNKFLATSLRQQAKSEDIQDTAQSLSKPSSTLSVSLRKKVQPQTQNIEKQKQPNKQILAKDDLKSSNNCKQGNKPDLDLIEIKVNRQQSNKKTTASSSISLPQSNNSKQVIVAAVSVTNTKASIPTVKSSGQLGKRKFTYRIDFDKLRKMKLNQKYKRIFYIEKGDDIYGQESVNKYSKSQEEDDYQYNEQEVSSSADQQIQDSYNNDKEDDWGRIILPLPQHIAKMNYSDNMNYEGAMIRDTNNEDEYGPHQNNEQQVQYFQNQYEIDFQNQTSRPPYEIVESDSPITLQRQQFETFLNNLTFDIENNGYNPSHLQNQ